MKRKLICLIAAFCLTCGMSHAVYAEDFTGSPDWTVTVTISTGPLDGDV